MMQKHIPLIIAGPTASGKSSYALEIAKKVGGAIINADSMQIYKELPILTAQPSLQDQAEAPHRLYGILAGDDICSAARWRELAIQEISWCQEHGLKPILVGGTGLYLLALIKGLSEIPDVDPDIRKTARELCFQLGSEAFYHRLIELDPLVAGHLNPNDSQRLSRAYEVKLSTGLSIVEWQNNPPVEPGIECEMHIIERPREILHQRATARFDQMLEQGAIEEVKSLTKQDYSTEFPVMRALGVKELASYIKGEVGYAQARELAIIATRQYIKRQCTFFRNQFPAAKKIELTL